jgi:C4-dicarboxylate transporter DctM subunit
MPAALADWVGHAADAAAVHRRRDPAALRLLGCVMDELSMLLLTIPVLFPAVMGMDAVGPGRPEDKAIWFGILVLMTVASA